MNKTDLLRWLCNCIDEFQFVDEDWIRLEYTIGHSLYCRIENPVILFENCRLPVFSSDMGEREKF
jgi:hypothetical protein